MKAATNSKKNGHTPAPVLAPSIKAVRLIPRNELLAQAELDNYDTAIAELDAAIAERMAAATLYDDADRKVRVIEERCRLLRLAVRLQLAVAVQ